MVITRAKNMAHLEQIRKDSSWLESLERILNNVGVLRDDTDKIKRMSFAKETEICVQEVLLGNCRFAADGAETGVCVLKVWTSVTFEGGHGVHVEGVVIDSEMV